MNINQAVVALSITLAAAILGGQSAHAQSATTATAKEPTPVVVTVQEGDTLSKIADEHKTTWVRIFNANEGLANPDVINAGDKVRIPREEEELPDRYSEIAAAQAAAQQQEVVAQTATTYTTRSYSSAPVSSNSYYVGNGMWCTDYVHSRRPDVPIYGDAGYSWISSAQAQGKATGNTPQAGAIAVTDGHVAYVSGVNADGTYQVQEMGWNYQAGNYNERTVQPGTFGAFIY